MRVDARPQGLRWLVSLCAFACGTPASAGETITYTYDALGRIANVAHAGSVNAGVQASYTHDATDNRSTVTVSGAVVAAPSNLIFVPLGAVAILYPSGS